jgi:hypothetical protein
MTGRHKLGRAGADGHLTRRDLALFRRDACQVNTRMAIPRPRQRHLFLVFHRHSIPASQVLTLPIQKKRALMTRLAALAAAPGARFQSCK